MTVYRTSTRGGGLPTEVEQRGERSEGGAEEAPAKLLFTRRVLPYTTASQESQPQKAAGHCDAAAKLAIAMLQVQRN